MITGKNHIGNQLVAGGTKTFKTFDPLLNQETDWVFTEASETEVNQAVELAWQAFEEYQNISGKRKAAFLREIANGIEGLGDDLVAVYCQESGLPAGRANGERGRTCAQLRAFADLLEEGSWVDATIDTAKPDRQPLPKVDLRKMLVPIGPIAVFGASNFPLAFSAAGGDTASALASGCPVVVKSHPMHAGTGEMVSAVVSKAAADTGMPKGVFSNLNSSGIAVGQQLVKHPKIKGVGFTGSIKGGRALFDAAAQREEPIPVFAEMGSINPVVFLPKALEAKATDWAKTYAGSITLGTGQFCTNPGLLLAVKSDALNTFAQTLSEEIVKVDPSCMLHPGIKANYDRNKQAIIDENKVSINADYQGELAPNFARQAVVQVDGATFIQNPKLHQEVFGPFSMVVACDDEAQLTQALANLEGQLTGTVIGQEEELDTHKKSIAALQNRVGRIIFNGVPTGVEVCPAMQHGGPYPASTDSRFTAVGVHAIKRWVRPMSYQNWPNNLLPEELRNENALGILRTVDNQTTTDVV